MKKNPNLTIIAKSGIYLPTLKPCPVWLWFVSDASWECHASLITYIKPGCVCCTTQNTLVGPVIPTCMGPTVMSWVM
jgi:hypothetical protein